MLKNELDSYFNIWRQNILKEIRHEDNLISQRLTWILVFNGFLFAFYGQLIRVKATNVQPYIEEVSQKLNEVQQAITSSTTIPESINTDIQSLSKLITDNILLDLPSMFKIVTITGICISVILLITTMLYLWITDKKWNRHDVRFPDVREETNNPIVKCSIRILLLLVPIGLSIIWGLLFNKI